MSNPRIGRRVMEEHRALERNVASQITPSTPIEEEIIAEIPPQNVDATVRDDPEAAGIELLKYLPEDVQLLIREASNHIALPIWQLLLGYTMRMHEMGELFVPYILAATWEAGRKANEPRTCKACGLQFISRFPTADYCCTPCHFMKLEQFGHEAGCKAVING